MFQYLKKIFTSKFVRNVALVATGTAGAQAITMAFSPIITRLYGPEAFGLLGTFTAILAVSTPIAALTYPIAIVLPKSDDDARGIARLSAGIALIMAMILTTLTLVGKNYIADLLNVQTIANFLWLIPIAMFFSALQQIMQQWLIRKNQFKITARIAVSQSFMLNSTKTGAGWFYPSGVALIILATLGNALYVVQLWFGARRWSNVKDRIHKSNVSLQSIKALAYKHRDFPLYRAPQVFLNAASQSMPVLMLASFFGASSAGLYALGRTVLGLPSSLLGKAISDVFYPKIAEAANAGNDIHTPVMKATLVLGMIGVVPYGMVFLFGPDLFSFIFGSEWEIAGKYASWLSIWLLFAFMNRPSVAAVAVLGLQGYFLIYEILSIVLRAVALVIGFLVFQSDLQAVILFSSVSVLLNALLISITLIKSKA